MKMVKPLIKKGIQYLRDSKSIKDKLKWLFETDERKVAIVGFVGGNAAEYISNCKNLEIYCWPLPHATNPDGIIALNEWGANVYFKEKLHAKIYWAEGRGVIIGSANLSDNALGEGGLSEFAVYIRDEKFNIDDVIKDFGLEGLSRFSKRQLNELQKKSRLPILPKQDIRRKRNKRSFEAYMNDEYRESIKLLYYDDFFKDEFCKKIEKDVGSFHDCNDCGRSIENGDVCLQIYINRGCIKRRKAITWFVVDEIVDYDKNRRVAIQKKEEYNTPFKIDDAFRSAFEKEFNSRGLAKIKHSTTSVIKDNFLESVLERMKEK